MLKLCTLLQLSTIDLEYNTRMYMYMEVVGHAHAHGPLTIFVLHASECFFDHERTKQKSLDWHPMIYYYSEDFFPSRPTFACTQQSIMVTFM